MDYRRRTRRRFEQDSEPFLGRLEFFNPARQFPVQNQESLLRMLLGGDVPVDFKDFESFRFRRASHPPVGNDHGSIRACGLVEFTLPVARLSQRSHDGFKRRRKYSSQEFMGQLSEGFGLGSALENLGSPVPIPNPAIQVANDDGVVGHLE
jgi:hypothetical protein